MADNEKNVGQNEPVAMELLSMLKEQNKRQASALKTLAIAFGFAVGAFVIAIIIVVKTTTKDFLSYLEKYDFMGNVEQTGVYTFSDSEGNIISSDISPEELRAILEVIDGDNTGDGKEN